MNPPDSKSPATGQPNQSPDQSAPTPMTSDGGDGSAVTETAKRDLDDIAKQAAADVEALQHQAGEQISAATDKAKSFAGEQKDFLAEQINAIADAVSKVAGELDKPEQKATARYARDLAGGLSSLSGQVKTNDVDQLMGKAQSFGREQPLAFLGAAALAGFLASRFAVASAHRNQTGKSKTSGERQSTYGERQSTYGDNQPTYGDGQSGGSSYAGGGK